jgi:hypothetical protein
VFRFRGLDTTQVAARVAEVAAKYKPDAIFIDNGSFGAGVVDRCRYMHMDVQAIDFGGAPDGDMLTAESGIRYLNKRAEMWGRMRDWLLHGMLPRNADLLAELTGVEYGTAAKNGREGIILERKEDMKKRGLASPDNADALALTFARHVAKADQSWKYGRPGNRRHEYEYDPFRRSD